MQTLEYDKPIKIFYANLLAIGVVVSVEAGRLLVDGNLEILSPVYREGIIKRARPLIELLQLLPPPELAPYFGRLLRREELVGALYLAETFAANVDALPVNGGWLLTMAKER